MFSRRALLTTSTRFTGRRFNASVTDKARESVADAAASAREAAADVADSARNVVKNGNPLLPIFAGVGTAVVGYTAFCYTKDEPLTEGITTVDYKRQKEARDRLNDETRRNTQRGAAKSPHIGHTELHFPDKKLLGVTSSLEDEREARRLEAALKRGTESNSIWKSHDFDVSVTPRHEPDGEKNDIRIDAVAEPEEPAPAWLAGKNEAPESGHLLRSRWHGNVECNTATNPNTERTPLDAKEEDSDRIYAKPGDVTKADYLGYDGGSRGSRDGQAMTDHAKRVATLP